jgi:arginyl-tRNA synthetase
MITARLADLLREAISAIPELDVPKDLEITIEAPARPQHGDFASNVALTLASSGNGNARKIAESIVGHLPETHIVESVEIAGPGFINFRLSHTWLNEVIREIAEEGAKYGRTSQPLGLKVQVEYGSPNPTGPITVGNARNTIYGDALASLLDAAGYEVTRENYLNDAGGQFERYSQSLEARYLQALGKDAAVPEDGYPGDYLIELGKQLAEDVGDSLIGESDEIGDWGLQRTIDQHKATLERIGVVYDNWFSEKSLHGSGKVTEAIEELRSKGVLYEKDGATWFEATRFGHHQDRVIIRSKEKGGRPTYRAADTAYLKDKLSRVDKAIYLWGADHHGAAEDLMALARAIGVDDQVEIIIYQFVNFFGASFGKRSGQFITLDDVIDEVGADAVRFTFLTRSPDSAMDFDFDLVKKQSQENPVYYVQYAHARISSVIRRATEQDIKITPVAEAPLDLLTHEAERSLMRALADLPEVIVISSNLRGPYRLTTYAREVAEKWHNFYENCRVITDDPDLSQARLWLAKATKQVLANTFAIIGISAPERM